MGYDATYEENTNSVDILVKNRFGEYSGTVQFTEYDPYNGKSSLQNPKLFLESPSIKNADFSKIREIDKVAVASSPRNKGTLANILEALYIFTKRYDIKYFVAEVNPYLIEKIEAKYGLKVKVVGETIKETASESEIQPIMVVVEDLIKHYENLRVKVGQ